MHIVRESLLTRTPAPHILATSLAGHPARKQAEQMWRILKTKGDRSMFRSTVITALFVLSGAASAFGQVGCVYHGTCTNPVPAVDISNQVFGSIWLDSGGGQNTITSSSGSIAGTLVAPAAGGAGCPDVTFTISGSLLPSVQIDGTQGNTFFTWTATNPSPSGACGSWVPTDTIITGHFQNDGNDYSSDATWSTSGGNGSVTFSKSPRDIPVSETTNPVGFGVGTNATVAQYRQVLNASSGSSDIFKGRQVAEYTSPNGTRYDNCWFLGSLVPKWDHVTGSEWNVGYYAVSPPFVTSLNTWVDDYIGWNTAQIDYIRAHGVAPCGARVPQAMYILTVGTSGASENYANDTVGGDISAGRIDLYRAGVTQTVFY
jgi:hypothetical protein